MGFHTLADYLVTYAENRRPYDPGVEQYAVQSGTKELKV